MNELNSKISSLRAGVAKSDLTVDDKARVHDRLYAKALVLDDGATRLVILAMDAVAIGGICDIPDSFLPRLRERIEHELGIPGANVLVNATHTHPPGRVLCDDDEQVARTFDAVARAAENLTPALVGVGIGHENRIAINRTLRLKDGQQWTIRQAYPCPPDDQIDELGPADDDIGVVRLDRIDGAPLAVLFTFACHPLIGVPGHLVTAQFPGFACRVIEEQLDGAMALFVQGAAGDMTELLYKDVHQPRNSEPLGTMLGLSTLRAWRGIACGEASLAVASKTIDLPRRQDSAERIAALEAQQAELVASLRATSLSFRKFLPLYLQYELNPEYPADYAYRYLHAEQRGSREIELLDEYNRGQLAKYRQNIDAMEQISKLVDDIATLRRHQTINAESGETTIAAEVMGVRIGDAVFVTSPAEVLVEVGRNVRAASPHELTFVAAFSNGYIHYGAPAADYLKGGYEVTECLLAPEWQALYEAAAAEVLAQL